MEQQQEEEVTTNISTNVIDATVTELMLNPFTLAINPSHHHHYQAVAESCNSQEFGGLLPYNESPRKKRIKIGNESGGGGGGVSKSKKRPDPFAPKITAPCAVCGRKFWSWKALFGHMRCHPERQWRGINPPPPPEGVGGNHRRQQQQQYNNNCGEGTSTTTTTTSSTNYNISSVSDIIIPNSKMTEEEHTVATSLLLLANGPSPNSQPPSCCGALQQVDTTISSLSCGRFECSSCKKVFGSHQALGGHRASHRNVKGCFQIARNYDEDDVGDQLEVVSETCTSNHHHHHECSICHRVFSSGQALGGHKRCHWEKGEASASANNNKEQVVVNSGMWDLNLPPAAAPPLDDNISSNCSYYSSPLVLDLRLGL